MPQRTFITDFSFDIDASTRLNIPAGWSGEVAEDVADAADEAGATKKSASKAKGKKGETADGPPESEATADQAPA